MCDGIEESISFGSKASDNGTLFSLPQHCPNVHLAACQNFEHSSSVVLEPLDDEQPLKETLTPAKKRRRAKGKAPISEDDLRRSIRLKKNNNVSSLLSVMTRIAWVAQLLP